jgi:alkanesulfonate monooxygenase SsuD/methylene tetrahydromethanopterin reductase-like flavin-dependent oxidoreductase (luciferase family)
VQAHFRWYLDLWTKAEARGFDGIFFSEHHFGAAYSPSPNLLVANLAARTSTIRLGVLGTVTPYATPWRVLEEFAMLDQLTGGRFEAGVVSGIPPEMGLAGVPMPVAGARHAEIVSAIDAAMHQQPVSHHGTEWNFDDLTIYPPMYQASPSMWTASRSRASAEKAAERGWKVCAGFNSCESIADMFDGYRKVAGEAGHPTTPDRLGLRRMVTFVDDPSKQREGIHTAKRSLLDLLNASAGPLPPFAALLDRPDESSDMLSDDEFVSGTPDQVAAELIRQAHAVGTSNIVVSFSAVDPGELDEAHVAFAEVVIPALRGESVS